MTMARPHSVSSYKDGFLKVDFCSICGVEGAFLVAEECQPAKEDKQLSLFEKAVDNGTFQP